MNMITKAILYAIEAHDGQYRKGFGLMPYVIHPIKVMNHIENDRKNMFYDIGEYVLVSACLHDVLEDTLYNLEGFSEDVINLVKLLTKEKNETKIKVIEKLKDNHDAIVIKLADRYDNCLCSDNEIQKEYINRKTVIESTQLLLEYSKKVGLDKTYMYKQLEKFF